MKKNIHNNITRITIEMKLFFLFCLISSIGIYGQTTLPSDAYYKTNDVTLQSFENNELPSKAYYNDYLRSGDEWDDDGGPGGSEEGDNQGVGVPAREGNLIILVCILIYAISKENQIKTL